MEKYNFVICLTFFVSSQDNSTIDSFSKSNGMKISKQERKLFEAWSKLDPAYD